MELDGIRYGFLTCYDFYFYEAFAALARKQLDIIIGCSLQRSDTHKALEIMGRFLAYNCNAHLVRASVSMDPESEICGASMIVTPFGDVLVNMKSRVGLGVAEFDPHAKYYKPAGFGGSPAPHYEYIEFGRNPWQYRPAGSAIVKHDGLMPYPRVCAHRGFSSIAPENSMPAFGAAVAMGAEEIEFDLWYTKDGEIVSIHDSSLERVSDGVGRVCEHTYAELAQLDFGSKHGERFAGMRVLRFEEILQKLSCHVVMNIHLKPDHPEPYPEEVFRKILDLIDRYDCRKYVYFMTVNPHVLTMAAELAPDIGRCLGFSKKNPDMVDMAVEYGCQKIQLFKPYFDQDMIDRAHRNGILCNVFFADEPEEAKRYLDMGIDTILTNDYHRVAQAVKEWKESNP